MRQLVLISGHICTGKSDLAQRLQRSFGYHIVKTSNLLKEIAEKRGLPQDRLSLQQLGDQLDQETRNKWVLDAVRRASCNHRSIVVDNIRTFQQLEQFRSFRQFPVIHVHLYAPKEELERRYKVKNEARPAEAAKNYSEADLIKNEQDIGFFKKDADVRVNTARTDGKDTLVRVAARLGLLSPPSTRCVDVLVGGQFGSEGKGHVAAYLAREYDVLMRVGGPNAGHTVASASGVHIYIHLPSGSKDTDAKLLIGPGATINPTILLREIEECKISSDRLFIDPQAMIISDDDIKAEADLKREISSTGQGSGAAASRRIMGRRPGITKLAQDISSLGDFVKGRTIEQLEIAYRHGQSVLLEGTQGSGLSIFHGQYPYVTSRDTNVAGCLAEAGISPSRVRRILMVVRPTPIRVGDPEGGQGFTSGRLKHPISFETLALRAGIDATEVKKHEIGSRSGKQRRIGAFEWDQFRDACVLNGPTDIVLTFADYIKGENREARRFEQLHQDTIKFVEELERVAQAPVSLINTRFPRDTEGNIDLRTIIDRRNWTTPKRQR